MRLSRAPDLGAPSRMAIAALVATLVAVVILSVRDNAHMALTLGDTDDAMRVVLMRELMAGTGWYDQLMMRLQPPLGLQMHWSRLIDGGMAALNGLFGLFVTGARAEYATRFVWPMLWIAPAVFSSLVVARRLAGGAAVFACAILLLTDLALYLQFRPGRVDHHGVQIALCLVAFAGAAWGSVRAAAIAGVAIGLGLAIGLEAAVFEVAVAAFFPLCFLFDRDEKGRRLQAFAIAFGLATVGFFLIQTPPWRWTAVACDAIAANLVAGVAVGCAGLIATVRVTKDRDWRWKLGALALTGAAAAGTYVGLNPHCLAGPFADVDPALKGFWLQWVQEIRSIPRIWPRDHATPITLMAPCVFGAIAWLWLGVDNNRRVDPVWILAGLVLAAASFAGFSAIRMATYANWVAMPIIAAAVTDLVDRYAKGWMVVLAVAAIAATPLYAATGVVELDKRFHLFGLTESQKAAAKAAPKAAPKPAPKAKAAPRRPGPRGDVCFRQAAFAELARLPPGLVAAEIDLGPFILAYTPHSAMAAPYHRMNWGMLRAREVLSAETEAAQVKARALGVRYVIDCPTHVRNADRIGMANNSLQRSIARNETPSWLEPVPTTGTLRVWRVKP
jgi:hypothetical protein